MSEYPPNFQPEVNTVYKVKLLEEIREIRVSWGVAKVCTIEYEGVEYSLWVSTVLFNKLKKMKAKPQDEVALIYKGKPAGKNYHDWSVAKWTPGVAAEVQREKAREPTLKRW